MLLLFMARVMLLVYSVEPRTGLSSRVSSMRSPLKSLLPGYSYQVACHLHSVNVLVCYPLDENL